jgi:hypothetical protein
MPQQLPTSAVASSKRTDYCKQEADTYDYNVIIIVAFITDNTHCCPWFGRDIAAAVCERAVRQIGHDHAMAPIANFNAKITFT